MFESNLHELSQRYPEQYRQFQDTIYVKPSEGLEWFYVMENISPVEDVILEICHSEHVATQERDRHILHEMLLFDHRQPRRQTPARRWSATANLVVTVNKESCLQDA